MEQIIYAPHGNGFGYRSGSGLALMCAAVIAGILIGAFRAVDIGTAADIPVWLHQYFAPVLSGLTPAQVFRHTLFSALMCLAAAFMSGLCAVGQPLGAALLVYRGMGIGAAAAIEYTLHGVSAVPAVLLLILPRAAAELAVLMLAVRELMRSSCSLMRSLLRSSADDDEQSARLRLYCIRFAVLAVISLFVSAAESVLCYLFAGMIG